MALEPPQETQDFQQRIDALLESYLGLLDEYSRLRAQLSGLQAGVFHNIARANFAAERGLRYGRDQYDERMRACRLLRVSASGEPPGAPSFRVERAVEPAAAAKSKTESPSDTGVDDGHESAGGESGEGGGGIPGDQPEPGGDKEGNGGPDGTSRDEPSTGEEEDARKEGDAEEEQAPIAARKDPLFWFGVLAPMPLRNAQSLAVEAVEQVIPRLVTVNAEMLQLEIEIGRARKKRAKLAQRSKESAPGEGKMPGNTAAVEAT